VDHESLERLLHSPENQSEGASAARGQACQEKLERRGPGNGLPPLHGVVDRNGVLASRGGELHPTLVDGAHNKFRRHVDLLVL